ncbi:hypothetical protein V6N11_014065 [Hibiscus sabdariffa]|uniref:Uncharacterized protein n=1 Tax=Hibiscus sabdariffa TaxID=183260 RepID=A0ABR2AFM6_9ROSI
MLSPAPGENGDGDVLRPSPVHQLEPHSSAVDVTDQPHSSGQQPCPASSADCGRASWSGGRNARANGMRFLEGTLESLSRDQGCFEKLRRSLEATVVCVPILPVRAYSAVRGGVRA